MAKTSVTLPAQKKNPKQMLQHYKKYFPISYRSNMKQPMNDHPIKSIILENHKKKAFLPDAEDF